MERHAELAIGVEQDEVIKILVAIEIDAAVAFDEMHLVGLEETKISVPSGDDSWIELDDIDLHLRHGAGEIGRNRAAAETDHQNAPDVLRVEQRRRHQPRIWYLQVVGVFEVDD